MCIAYGIRVKMAVNIKINKRKIKQKIEKANLAVEITVGIHKEEDARSESDLSNAQIGFIHEFGVGVPQRSFLRSTLANNKREYRKQLQKIVNSGSKKKLKKSLALQAEMDVKDTITKGIPPPLADSTIKKKKGQDTPLIDTGQFLESIKGKVIK